MYFLKNYKWIKEIIFKNKIQVARMHLKMQKLFSPQNGSTL